MTTLYRYRMTCLPTGGATSTSQHIIWDTQAPTVCPTQNATHILDLATISVIEEVSDTIVKIKEEDVVTGGHIQVTSRCSAVTGPTGSIQIFDYTIPVNVNLVSVAVPTGEMHMGDMYEVHIAPETTIGYLTTGVSTGATALHVSQTVVDNIQLGYFVTLFNGVYKNDLGRVLTIDKVGKIITTHLTPTNSYATYSLVKMTIKVADELHIGPPGLMRFGDDKVGSSFLPAFTTLRVKYWNKTGGSKNFVTYATLLY